VGRRVSDRTPRPDAVGRVGQAVSLFADTRRQTRRATIPT